MHQRRMGDQKKLQFTFENYLSFSHVLDSQNSPKFSISENLDKILDKRSHIVDPFSFQSRNKFKFY